jgi:hypothetical protein
MSAVKGMTLTPQEALARDVILQRSAARHHAPRRQRRHVRVALLLRRLAERLDPDAHGDDAAARRGAHGDAHGGAPVVTRSGHDRSAPRPWQAQPRRSPHRHS